MTQPRETKPGKTRSAKRPYIAPTHSTGERRLRDAIKRRRPKVRKDDPTPYDKSWGWWIDKRLARVEARLKWILGLALTTLAAEVTRILLAALNLD